MTTALKIDFVSDVSCPWCVIGLKALDQALANVKTDITAEIHFQPFELNPQMAAEGQEITEHITQKYGISPEQANANRENIRQRGAEVTGLTESPDGKALFVNIQHPGENTTNAQFTSKIFESNWPGNGMGVAAYGPGGASARPRSATRHHQKRWWRDRALKQKYVSWLKMTYFVIFSFKELP